jgi:hypothetical protein
MQWSTLFKTILGKIGWFEQPRSSYAKPTSLSYSVDPRELGYTRNAKAKMQEWHLSEKDVEDVFYHGGSVVKPQMMVKKYNGYEIGLYFFQDKQTGRTIISSAWKQDRY